MSQIHSLSNSGGGGGTGATTTLDTTNFNGWLSSADTNVQLAADTLDDSQRCVEITGASANLVNNKGVIANRGTLVTLLLPATSKIGDTIEVCGKGVGLWKITQNAGQTIHFGVVNTTTGIGGSLSATLQYDCLKLICITADTDFIVSHSFGNITWV